MPPWSHLAFGIEPKPRLFVSKKADNVEVIRKISQKKHCSLRNLDENILLFYAIIMVFAKNWFLVFFIFAILTSFSPSFLMGK
jgi:hypothetical protein